MNAVFNLRSNAAVFVRRLVFAIVMALFLALLGIFSGIGYQVYSIKELSFEPNYELGYAEVVFSCDIICNPILYPYYWLVGNGRVRGDFSIMQIPESYSPGEFGGPIYMTRQQRLDSYAMSIVTWGTTLNLIALFFVTGVIEIVGKRILYLSILGGAIGFVANIIGLIIGVIFGTIVAILIMLKLPPFGPSHTQTQ
jgi:hypothetical protein